MTAHLCLVSDQPVPSLTPLLDPSLAVREVILVHAPKRARQAAWLAAALKRHDIAAEVVALADGYDLPGLRREMSALAARHPAGCVANITGGTKMMTIAAWETFRRPADRLYYVDIRRDSLRWLRPQAPEQAVADHVKIESYLLAHGYAVQGQATRQSPGPEQLKAARDKHAWLLEPVKQGKKPPIAPGGYWLEHLLFAEFAELTKNDRRLQDLARGLVIYPHEHRHAGNELDVVCLRDNTLYLVECKTGRQGKGPMAADAIYKLSQLSAAIGGLRGRGIFVTSETVSGPIRQRAESLGIFLIDRASFANLRMTLAAILAGRAAG